MIAIAVFVFGMISLVRLPMDLMPEMSYPTVTVRTAYPGAAPEDVEDRVSRRLEQSLSVVKGLRRISSISRAESSDVVLEFRWDADMKASVQDVREKLDQTFLPDEAESPTILRYDPSLDPIMQIGLVAPGSLESVRLIAEEIVERRLETVPGVAAVKVRGGLEEEIRIEVDEALVRGRGITLQEVSNRLRQENLDQASGLLREGNVTYLVRTRNELGTLEEIASIPIRRDGDSVTRLSDIARVTPTYKDDRVITRIDGRPAVKIEVYREAGENIVDLAQRVKDELYGTEAEREQLEKRKALLAGAAPEELVAEDEESDESKKRGKKVSLARPDFVAAYLPEGGKTTILSDQSVFIQGAIDDLLQTALLGGLIAVAVLFAFLGRLSYTLIVAASIPFSVVATFAPMYLGSISLNIMSLGGIALGIGMLVDSSIVVLESIFRRVEAGDRVYEAAVRGASEVGSAVLASTLTTVAVFFPIVFVEGVAGQIFRDQSLTVVYALIASLVVSLTLIPMLVSRLDRSGSLESVDDRRWFWSATAWPRLKSAYTSGSLLARSLRVLILPYYLLAIVVEWIGYAAHFVYMVTLASIGAVFRVSKAVGVAVTGLPLRLTGRVLSWVESAYVRLLRAALSQRALVGLVVVAMVAVAVYAGGRLGSELIPEVAQGEFVVHLRYPVGTPIETTAARSQVYERALVDVPEIASVSTTVGVDPDDVSATDEGEHTARFRIRVARTREKLEDVESRVLQTVSEIFGGVKDHTIDVSRPVLFSFKTPIEVEVRGHRLDILQSLARDVERVLVDYPGVKDVRSTVSSGSPEYHIYPDRDKMMRYGVTGAQLAEVLRRKNMGEVATRFRQKDRKVDVRVQLEESDRDTIDKLLGTVVRIDEAGRTWTLADFVADYEVREGPAEIRRIDQQRAAVVSAGLTGLDLGRVTEGIEKELLNELVVPPEFDVEVVGQKKEMERSRASLLAALALAIFLVYVVMASQFESLLQPFVILFTIPLAVIGVVLTLYVTGTSLSVMAFIGMIMLAGIVVNNAIVLLDQINRLRQDGFSVHEAIVEGGRRRLRPILMTTLTTVLAMFPLTGVLAQIPHDAWLDFVLGSGQGAEIRAPMAYTVIGGLSSSTFLTLLVIPVVYSLVTREKVVRPTEELA